MPSRPGAFASSKRCRRSAVRKSCSLGEGIASAFVSFTQDTEIKNDKSIRPLRSRSFYQRLRSKTVIPLVKAGPDHVLHRGAL